MIVRDAVAASINEEPGAKPGRCLDEHDSFAVGCRQFFHRPHGKAGGQVALALGGGAGAAGLSPLWCRLLIIAVGIRTTSNPRST